MFCDEIQFQLRSMAGVSQLVGRNPPSEARTHTEVTPRWDGLSHICFIISSPLIHWKRSVARNCPIFAFMTHCRMVMSYMDHDQGESSQCFLSSMICPKFKADLKSMIRFRKTYGNFSCMKTIRGFGARLKIVHFRPEFKIFSQNFKSIRSFFEVNRVLGKNFPWFSCFAGECPNSSDSEWVTWTWRGIELPWKSVGRPGPI